MYTRRPARFIPAFDPSRRRLFANALLAGAALLVTAAVLQAVCSSPVPTVERTSLNFNIGGAPAAVINYSQKVPITSTSRGVNVFPALRTEAEDGAKGFMSYSDKVVGLLQKADVKVLRFPGGNWGDEHDPSYDQLDAFIRLAEELGAEPAMQVRLRGGGVEQALRLVDYLNNPENEDRISRNAPFKPVKYWMIGNEPSGYETWGDHDVYTASDYARDFIAYAEALKTADPSVQVIGTEQHQFQVKDSSGNDWMKTFLTLVAAHEKKTGKSLLDVVSFHTYPLHDFMDEQRLLGSPAKYPSMIGALRSDIKNILGRSLPIAVTEIGATSAHSLDDGFGEESVITALWWADTYGALASSGVEQIFFFAAQGLGPPLALLSRDEEPLPAYYAFAQTGLLRGGMAISSFRNEDVSVYVSHDVEGKSLSAMLINKSRKRIDNVTIEDRTGNFGPKQPVPISLSPLSITVVVLEPSQAMEVASYGYDQARERAGIKQLRVMADGTDGNASSREAGNEGDFSSWGTVWTANGWRARPDWTAGFVRHRDAL